MHLEVHVLAVVLGVAGEPGPLYLREVDDSAEPGIIAGLQFVARQELIFGTHVHVGLDDPDKAIHVTNGMRVHMIGVSGGV